MYLGLGEAKYLTYMQAESSPEKNIWARICQQDYMGEHSPDTIYEQEIDSKLHGRAFARYNIWQQFGSKLYGQAFAR